MRSVARVTVVVLLGVLVVALVLRIASPSSSDSKLQHRNQSASAPGSGSSIGGCNGCSWNGDFSTGNFRQYNNFRSGNINGNPADFRLVTSDPTPPKPFKYAFDAHLDVNAVGNPGEPGEGTLAVLYPNAVPTQSSAPSRAYAGATTWYRDELYFPASYQPASNTNWNWTDEVHNAPNDSGISMLACGVDTSTGTTITPSSDGGGDISPARFSCRIAGGGDAAHPLDGYKSRDWFDNPAMHYGELIGLRSITPGVWYDMVWEFHWSCTTGGWVTWWIDGKQVGHYNGPTLEYVKRGEDGYPTNGCNQGYWDDGDYRPAGLTTPSDVLHAGTMNGPTAASIGERLP